MKTKSICSAFFAVVAIFLTVAAFTGCGKRAGNANHSLREDNAAFEAKDGENAEELSGKGNAAFEVKDLEIATIQLEQYSGSVRSTQPDVRTQSVSIANRSDKTIDLYGYSVTNNEKEILRIKEHVKLEKDAKKVFPLPLVDTGKENRKQGFAIEPWFLYSIVFKDENEAWQEREELATMMERYLPYLTELSKTIFEVDYSTGKYSFYFSEIALKSPRNETVDQILLTKVDVQKNPYSLVAFLEPIQPAGVFRKGDYIIVCSIPEMTPFPVGIIFYSGQSLAILTSGNQYFSENTGLFVPDQKMTLSLYRDQDLKEEMVRLEGEKFFFNKMSEAQTDELDKFLDGARMKEVYYKLSVTHPDFPELSLPEPLTGKVNIQLRLARSPGSGIAYEYNALNNITGQVRNTNWNTESATGNGDGAVNRTGGRSAAQDEYPGSRLVNGILYSEDGSTLISCVSAPNGPCIVPPGVKTIADRAFSGCAGLTEVRLPEGITKIGRSAFWKCSGLKRINLPDSLEEIGTNAFEECTGLTEITIPQGIRVIKSSTFIVCAGLKRVDLPDSLTEIEFAAFTACTGLTEITIPPNVTSIGESAFAGCTGLKHVTLPDSLKSISPGAFSGCESLDQETRERLNKLTRRP